MKLIIEDRFRVTGVGEVLVCYAPEASKEHRGTDWMGREVEIHGRLARIRALETHAMARPIRAGDSIGFVVDFLDERP